jgi:hypothetical protein
LSGKNLDVRKSSRVKHPGNGVANQTLFRHFDIIRRRDPSGKNLDGKELGCAEHFVCPIRISFVKFTAFFHPLKFPVFRYFGETLAGLVDLFF